MVELQERILSLSLDRYASELLTNSMLHAGVDIITGHSVAAVTGRPATPNIVGGVVLDDGRHIPSDMVVMAIGVRPNTDLAKAAGLKVNRGIVVDNRMATSAPDVYACGDVAEAPSLDGGNKVVPLWPLAYMGGRAAGINMAGGNSEYVGGVSVSTLKYFDNRIMSAGRVDPDNNDSAEGLEVLVSNSGPVYRKVVVQNDRLVGILFSKDVERSGLVFGLMREGVDVKGFKNSLVADSFGLVALPTSLRHKMLAVVEEGSEII
jgi:NAD(P)H-nitrite reductase large subunit